MPTTWKRLTEGESWGVNLEITSGIDDQDPEAIKLITGIYVNDKETAYKVVYSAVERDDRGHKYRRQRTRQFSRKHKHTAPLADGTISNTASAFAAALAFKDKVDAASRATRVMRQDNEAMTLNDWFAVYMKAKELRPTTRRLYEGTYSKWIGPPLGDWLIRELSIDDVEAWANGLTAQPGARRVAIQLLKALMAGAVARGVIPANPARVLSVGQPPIRSIAPDDVPTPEQVEALAKAAGDRYSALVYVLAYVGLRIGEAVALRVDRIDFLRRRITIDQAATEVRGALTFGLPKTSAGNRTITAPAFLVELLSEHIARFPTTGLVFSAPDGGALRPGNFRSRVFTPAAEAVGLPELHIHDLRHVAASQLAADGGTAVEIAARLGQANAAITQRVYTHLLRARDERLAGLQDERFRARLGVDASS